MRRISIILCFFLIGLCEVQAQELEEASGLEPQAPLSKDAETFASTPTWLRWRGYGALDYGVGKSARQDRPREDGPHGEIALAFDVAEAPTLTFFLEQRTQAEAEGRALERVHALWEQGGFRYRPLDSFLFVVGKERNRRAPGLIVSPSDFIHSNPNLPGLREERSGVWLARAAYQGPHQSFDLMALPATHENEQGMIGEGSRYKGTVARYWGRLESGWDLGVDYGRFEDDSQAGLFVQTMLAAVWKVYAEGGYRSESDAQSTLLGGSYEGSSDWNLRLEWYQQDEHWRPSLFLLQDRNYLIVSLSVMELWDTFNLTPTLLQSLESQTHQAGILRAEWLMNQRQVAGLTFVSMNADTSSPWQLNLDWKINF
jgi:hypothetical protein